MKPLKPIMNDVDELVGEIYGLTDEQITYIQNYLTDEDGEYGPSGHARHGLPERVIQPPNLATSFVPEPCRDTSFV